MVDLFKLYWNFNFAWRMDEAEIVSHRIWRFIVVCNDLSPGINTTRLVQIGPLWFLVPWLVCRITDVIDKILQFNKTSFGRFFSKLFKCWAPSIVVYPMFALFLAHTCLSAL